MQASTTTNSSTRGVVVVVAKCPIPGKSKTRLIPLVGEKGSARLAKAMLSDVLLSLVRHMSRHLLIMLCYAPGTEDGRRFMYEILLDLGIVDFVSLFPMLSTDLHAADLGDQLLHALLEARRKIPQGYVMFLGMDSPELPIEELEEALRHPSHATLCPSHDGGYGMLCVPPGSPNSIFSNVLWSHPLTALSQLKALSDSQVPTRLGRIMFDVDEPDDARRLLDRVLKEGMETQQPRSATFRSLQVSSACRDKICSDFPLTKQALLELKDIIVKGS